MFENNICSILFKNHFLENLLFYLNDFKLTTQINEIQQYTT